MVLEAAGSSNWNSTATDGRSVEESLVFEEIDLSQHLDVLRPGNNLLALDPEHRYLSTLHTSFPDALHVTNGVLEEDGEYWDSAGQLVCVSRQTAKFRLPKG